MIFRVFFKPLSDSPLRMKDKVVLISEVEQDSFEDAFSWAQEDASKKEVRTVMIAELPIERKDWKPDAPN